MHLKNILKFSSAVALMAVVMFTTNYDVFAQKGHGKGHSKDQGDGGGNRKGNGEKWKGEDRQDRGDRGRSQQQQQQVWVVRQPREQNKRDDGGWRRQQEWNARQSQQQAQNDWNAQRQQQLRERQRQMQQAQIDWNARRQQEIIRNQSRQKWVRKERRNDDYATDNGYYGRRERDRRVRQVYAYPNQNASIWRGLWSGRQFDRRDDKRYLKEQKRAWKADLKSQRRYEKDALRYSWESRRRLANVNYDNNYYADQTDNNYGYDDNTNWKEQILRVVIANVIGNRLGGDQRDTNSQYGQFYDNYPYNSSYDRGGSYNEVPRFIRSYGTPYSDEYQPEYGEDGSRFGANSAIGGLLNSLPIAELLERYTGGNEFVSELIANFLAQGYDQGYVAGQSARRNRSGEGYFR
ncbi:MAG: hypothetical protein ABIU09_12420, partial [Pyrinomonadaceae bacterium]